MAVLKFFFYAQAPNGEFYPRKALRPPDSKFYSRPIRGIVELTDEQSRLSLAELSDLHPLIEEPNEQEV